MSDLLSGRIEDRALPTLLVEMAQKQVTGVLRIDARTGRHEIYVREGQPVAVILPGAAELIGKVLVEMGFLDEATHRQTLASPPPPGTKYGDMLVDRNLVTIDQLRLALKAQVRRKLHRVFFLNDGGFAFEPGDHAQGMFRGESLKVQAGRAIYQGVRSAWSAERLSSSLFLLSSQAFRCLLSSEDLVRYGLGAHDAQIGELLRKGYYTLESLAQATKAPQQPLLSLVYALYVTNALEIKSANAVKVESAAVSFTNNPSPSASGPRQTVPTPTRQTVPTPAAGLSGAHRIPTPGSGAHRIPQTPSSVSGPHRVPSAGSGTYAAVDMRTQISQKARTVEKEDFFQVLGVPDGASIDAVKAAYFELAKRYHPDRIAPQGLESQRQEIELIFRRVNEAYSTLSDDAKRAEYLKRRADGTLNPEAQAKALAMIEADNAFRRGEMALRRNDMQTALREFADAVAKNPQEGEYLAFHTWTRLCLSQLRHAEAKPIFQQAVKLAPKCGRAHYYLGLCYKEENDVDRAATSFQKAIDHDQRLIEAERELRLINMRRKDSKPKGFLDKLRGR